jgi:hypothetical protein
VKEFILRTKKNETTGYNGIPVEVWKELCTMRDGTEIVTNMHFFFYGSSSPFRAQVSYSVP